ncbi:lipopolysaccharide assembly protein LapA domain-containing protein [Planctomycetota bacterium]
MKNFKIILIIVVLTLAVVVALQNKEQVETKFLFTSITMPRVLLLLSTLTLGFFIGLITASLLRRKAGKAK